MATNNTVNNNFPAGIVTNGSLNINTSGSAITSIGSSASGAITINANALNFNINNNDFTINTGSISSALTFKSVVSSGNLNVGSSSTTSLTASSTNATLTTGTSSTNMVFNLAGATGITIGNPGNTSIQSSGNINIGNSSAGAGWNIGTGSNAHAIVIGNTSNSSNVSLDSGTGAIQIGITIPTVSIGNNSTSTGINISTGTGGIQYPGQSGNSGTFTMKAGLYNQVVGASLATATLPTTASIGQIFRIIGNLTAPGSWKIAQNAGQTIYSTAANTTTGTGGSLSANGIYDCIELVCTTANTDFVIVNSYGTFVFV